jgi:soluble lytic murein transglycosylase-like protein
MITIHRVLFTAVLAGCLTILAVTHWIASPTIVLASTQPVKNDQNEPENTPETEAKPQSCSLSGKFPEAIMRWCNLIETEADRNNLDAGLLAAIIYVESGGNQDAYSRSGAAGLMQVMPRDGIAASFQCVNGPCFASRPGMAELFDPSFNISYGSRMLAGLVNRHDSIREALKAYGPMDVGYTYADLVLKVYSQ